MTGGNVLFFSGGDTGVTCSFLTSSSTSPSEEDDEVSSSSESSEVVVAVDLDAVFGSPDSGVVGVEGVEEDMTSFFRYGSDPESDPSVGVASVEGVLKSTEYPLANLCLVFRFFLPVDVEADFFKEEDPLGTSVGAIKVVLLSDLVPNTESLSLAVEGVEAEALQEVKKAEFHLNS